MTVTRTQKAIAYIPCLYCKAKPGMRCVTDTGNVYPMSFAHEIRLAPFYEEWQAGYQYARYLDRLRAEANEKRLQNA